MSSRGRWTAALAAVVLACGAVALAWVARPTAAERTEAREQACAMLVMSIFGGPGFAAALLGETDALPDEFDASTLDGVEPDLTLADIDAAGPAFADPLGELVAVGAVHATGEELSAEQAERYSEALIALSSACEEAGLLDQDGAAEGEQPDDPAVQDMVDRLEAGSDGATGASD